MSDTDVIRTDPSGRISGNITAPTDPDAPPVYKPDPTVTEAMGKAKERVESAESEFKSEQDVLRKPRTALSRELTAPLPQPPMTKPLGPAPDAKNYQKHSAAWLGAMAMLGALGAKSGRMTGTAALNAFAGAMKGWQEGNLLAYDQAADKWERDSKATIENNRQLLEKYRMVMENHRLNIDQQIANLEVLAVEHHDSMMFNQTQAKNYTAIAQLYDRNNKATYDAEVAREELLHTRRQEQQKQEESAAFWLSPRGQEILARPEGTPGSIPMAQKAGIQQIIEMAQMKGLKPGSPAAIIEQENREREARGESRMTAQETIEFMQQARPPRSAPAIAFQDWKREFRAANGRDPTSDEEMDFRARYEGTISAARVTAAAEPRALANTLTQLTKQKASIEQFERTAIANGEKLKELAGKVDVTGRPAIERWIRAGRQASGDPEVAAFNTQMQVYKAEVAKIITNPNLTGVLSDQARREVDTFMGGGASARQITAVVDLLRQDFGRRMDSLNDEITSVQSQIKGGGGEAKVPPKASPTSGGPQPGTKMHYDEQGNLVQ